MVLGYTYMYAPSAELPRRFAALHGVAATPMQHAACGQVQCPAPDNIKMPGVIIITLDKVRGFHFVLLLTTIMDAL